MRSRPGFEKVELRDAIGSVIAVIVVAPFFLAFTGIAGAKKAWEKQMLCLATRKSTPEELQLLRTLRRSLERFLNRSKYLQHPTEFNREEFLKQMPQSKLGIPRGYGFTFAERMTNAMEEATEKAKEARIRKAEMQRALQQCFSAGISRWKIQQFLNRYGVRLSNIED